MNEAVALVVQHRVKPGQMEPYEAWLKEIAAESRSYPRATRA